MFNRSSSSSPAASHLAPPPPPARLRPPPAPAEEMRRDRCRWMHRRATAADAGGVVRRVPRRVRNRAVGWPKVARPTAGAAAAAGTTRGDGRAGVGRRRDDVRPLAPGGPAARAAQQVPPRCRHRRGRRGGRKRRGADDASLGPVVRWSGFRGRCDSRSRRPFLVLRTTTASAGRLLRRRRPGR